MSNKVILFLIIISFVLGLIIHYILLNKKTCEIYIRSVVKGLSKVYIITFFVFFNILFFVIVALIFLKYETNDDIAMLLIASGKYSGIPLPFLPYMNYFYGYIVSIFYINFPEIEWYTMFFVFFHFISIFILIFNIYRLEYRTTYKFVLYLLIVFFEVYLIAHFQFTTTSMLVSIAGLISIFKGEMKMKFLGFFLFIFGFLIRDFSSAIVLLSFLPFMIEDIKVFFKNLHAKKLQIPINLWFVFFIVTTMFCFKIFDTYKYNQNNGMKDYRELDHFRSLTTDPMPTQKMMSFSGDSIVSKKDMSLIQSFYFDTKKYNLKFYKYIYNNYTQPNLTDRVNNLLKTINKTFYVLLSFLIMIVFLYLKSKSKNEKTVYLVTFFIFSFSFFILSIFTDFSYKGRVIITIFFPFLIVLVNNLPRLSKNDFIVFIILLINLIMAFMNITFIQFLYLNLFLGLFLFFNLLKTNFKFICLYFSIVFFMFFAFSNLDDWRWKKDDNKKRLLEYQSSVDDFFKISNFKKIAYFPIQYNYELINPFEISHTSNIDKVLLNGWLANLPYNKREFESFDIFIKKGTPIMLTKGNKKNLGLIIDVINSEKEINIETIFTSKSYEIIKLVETNKIKI